MKRKPYNGWFNRATWNVALWIGNDEGLYRMAMDAIKAMPKRIAARDAELLCRDLFPGGETPDGDKLVDCHWPSIAHNLRDMRG